MNDTVPMGTALVDRRRHAIAECTALARSAGRPLLFGMTTALELQAIPLPEGCDLDPSMKHVTSADRRSRLRGPGIHCHVWKQADTVAPVRINPDVAALAPAQAWAQLAMHVPAYGLIALADAIVATPPDRTDQQEALCTLRSYVEHAPRFMGKVACAAALPHVATGVASPQETKTRLTLLGHQVPCPETNHQVPGLAFRSGAPVTLDMAWPECRVAVEYDGDQHRTDRAQWRRDQEKREMLRRQGWIVICVNADNLATRHSRAEFAFAVARELLARGAKFVFAAQADGRFGL